MRFRDRLRRRFVDQPARPGSEPVRTRTPEPYSSREIDAVFIRQRWS